MTGVFVTLIIVTWWDNNWVPFVIPMMMAIVLITIVIVIYPIAVNIIIVLTRWWFVVEFIRMINFGMVFAIAAVMIACTAIISFIVMTVVLATRWWFMMNSIAIIYTASGDVGWISFESELVRLSCNLDWSVAWWSPLEFGSTGFLSAKAYLLKLSGVWTIFDGKYKEDIEDINDNTIQTSFRLTLQFDCIQCSFICIKSPRI